MAWEATDRKEKIQTKTSTNPLDAKQDLRIRAMNGLEESEVAARCCQMRGLKKKRG
jgi:hypothetical protein